MPSDDHWNFDARYARDVEHESRHARPPRVSARPALDARGTLKQQFAPVRPNAPTAADVRRVQERVRALGLAWIDAANGAGLSRATSYRFATGEASLGSLRRIEAWLDEREAQAQAKKPLCLAGATSTEGSVYLCQLVEGHAGPHVFPKIGGGK